MNFALIIATAMVMVIGPVHGEPAPTEMSNTISNCDQLVSRSDYDRCMRIARELAPKLRMGKPIKLENKKYRKSPYLQENAA